MFRKRLNRRGQVTIFIIIAIVIVAAVVAYFIFRGSLVITKVPASMEPVYNAFLFCLEEDTRVGVDILESQGGYIELPEFEPGSGHSPFSSQLNFFGNLVPYWYYVSGNNIEREQIPSKADMEEQLEIYIEQEIRDCAFDDFHDAGFRVSMAEPQATVTINDNNVDIVLNMDMELDRAEESAIVNSHELTVQSNLGALYESAKKVYNYEQTNLFLENYAVDTLRLYAPVDGVEMTCSPLVWSASEVFDELRLAIEDNTAAIRTKTSDFELSVEENKYFVLDLPVQNEVRFMTSQRWPGWALEVSPTEDNVLMAKPVGNQPGLGAIGFCYVPYHFVYDVKYPVLVQVMEGEEIFQFPMAVVLEGNNPREPLETVGTEVPDAELCENRNTLMEVNTYDNFLNAVDADITFTCFSQSCVIGTTGGGTMTALFPQCVNGFVLAQAEGFKDEKHYVESTAESGVIDIVLTKLYEQRINLKLNGQAYNGEAIITFSDEETTQSVIYPIQDTIELSEGQYEIRVDIYRNTSLKLSESTQEHCMDVPQTGVGALLGLTDEKCFDITVPEQIISNALAGGGIEQYYITESELESSSIIDINAPPLPTPKSIEELQNNYVVFEESDLDILFK